MSGCESVRGEWGGICPDCGQVLPKLRPWSEGRPCARSALERGYGWDGRPAVEHTEKNRQRWSSRPVAGKPLTERQEEVLRIVANHGGNRHAAARELGIASSTLFVMLARIEKNRVEAAR